MRKGSEETKTLHGKQKWICMFIPSVNPHNCVKLPVRSLVIQALVAMAQLNSHS